MSEKSADLVQSQAKAEQRRSYELQGTSPPQSKLIERQDKDAQLSQRQTSEQYISREMIGAANQDKDAKDAPDRSSDVNHVSNRTVTVKADDLLLNQLKDNNKESSDQAITSQTVTQKKSNNITEKDGNDPKSGALTNSRDQSISAVVAPSAQGTDEVVSSQEITADVRKEALGFQNLQETAAAYHAIKVDSEDDDESDDNQEVSNRNPQGSLPP